MSEKGPNTKEVIVIKSYRFLDKYRTRILVISSAATGFLIGTCSNLLADPDVQDFYDILNRMFYVVGRPINWLNWMALLVAIVGYGLALVIMPFMRRWRKKQSYETVLKSVLQSLKHESVSTYDAIAVDKAITLQKCPEMERGWMPSEVEVHHKTERYQLPKHRRQDYERYRKDEFANVFREDGDTVMLEESPKAWTDSPDKLHLKTRMNLFSCSRFYWHRVANEPDWRAHAIDDLCFRDKITFPNDLCLHLIILTSDDYVLITRRSAKVADRPQMWSVSIEERFRPEDIRHDRIPSMMRCVSRALFEELGLESDYYAQDNVRILSVFLESDLPNIAIAALVTLEINREELDAQLSLPRPDYEFIDRDYLHFHLVSDELIVPSRSYHPTSRYRMLMLLLHRFGEPGFAKKFMESSRRLHRG